MHYFDIEKLREDFPALDEDYLEQAKDILYNGGVFMDTNHYYCNEKMVSVKSYFNRKPFKGEYKDDYYIQDVPLVEDLLRDLILDEEVYKTVTKKIFSGQIPSLEVNCLFKTGYGDRFADRSSFAEIGEGIDTYYTRSQIVMGLNKLETEGSLHLNPKTEKRLEVLRQATDFERMKADWGVPEFIITMDKNTYALSIQEMLNIFTLHPNDFLAKFRTSDNLCGIDKSHFVYAAKEFFAQSGMLDNFVAPKSIFVNLDIVTSSLSPADDYAINKDFFDERTNAVLDKITLDKELHDTIMNRIPADCDDVEKAMRLYIEICKIVEYDEEFWVFNQSGPTAEKHYDPRYVNNITLKNNSVVCYEFAAIYASLLRECGIDSKFFAKNPDKNYIYSDGHADLRFRVGDFVIRADPAEGRDFASAKLNLPLDKFDCENPSKAMQQDFAKRFYDVYSKIAEEEASRTGRSGELKEKETTENLIEEYKKINNREIEIPFEDKLNILFSKTTLSHLIGIDCLYYMLDLRKLLFSPAERAEKMAMTIIRDKSKPETGREAVASAIITVNEEGLSTTDEIRLYPEYDNNTYYYFNPANKMPIEVKREELQSKFDDKTFSYIRPADSQIPGVEFVKEEVMEK